MSVTGKRAFGLALMAMLAASAPAAAMTPANELRIMVAYPDGVPLAEVAQGNNGLANVLRRLMAEAEANGTVDVMVRTAVPYAPEWVLGRYDKTVQRVEIADAARRLKQALPLNAGFAADEDRPYVRLTLDTAGLERLGQAVGLARVAPAAGFNKIRDLMQMQSAHRRPGSVTRSDDFTTPQIVGGANAAATSHPFQVGLLAVDAVPNSDRGAFFCGGTLVNQKYVVTAASCTYFVNNQLGSVRVVAGARTLSTVTGTNSTGAVYSTVTKITPMAGFNADGSSFDQDAAVLELGTPITTIASATLPPASSTPPASVRLTGWGSTALDDMVSAPPVNLQEVTLNTITNAVCQTELAEFTPGASSFCTAGSATKDVCDMDAGGPITSSTTAPAVLVGIIGYAPGCGSGDPSVHTNVANAGVLAFVNSNITAPPAPKTVSMNAATVNVSESSRALVLTLKRANTTGHTRVRVSLETGTATRADFRGIYRIARFRPNSDTATIIVPIVRDGITEPAEGFTARITRLQTGWTAGTQSSTAITITD